jgi:hypothetical protein
MRAKIHTARFPSEQILLPMERTSRENMRGGLSETPAGRRQHCRVRHRLGRLLVEVTYKSGTK